MPPPIKKYVDDPSLTWEERYKRLDAHHVEETTVLLGYIKRAHDTLLSTWDAEQHLKNELARVLK